MLEAVMGWASVAVEVVVVDMVKDWACRHRRRFW